MSIGTYSDLQTRLQKWLARSDADIVERIPEFIELLEAQLNRDVKHPSMEVQTTLVTVASTEIIALPTDYVEARVLVVQTTPKAVLGLVTPQQLAENWAAGTTGIPSEYSIIGSNVHLGQIPDGAYNVLLTYYQKIAALTDAAPTNWMLTDHPDIYLYGALLQAAPYLMNDERIPVWGTFFDRGIQTLENDLKRAAWNGGPLRTRVDVTVR